MDFIPSFPQKRKRAPKIGKKLASVNAEFASLPHAHKKAPVYYALGRCAGIKDETLRKHATVSIALIEGAS